MHVTKKSRNLAQRRSKHSGVTACSWSFPGCFNWIFVHWNHNGSAKCHEVFLRSASLPSHVAAKFTSQYCGKVGRDGFLEFRLFVWGERSRKIRREAPGDLDCWSKIPMDCHDMMVCFGDVWLCLFPERYKLVGTGSQGGCGRCWCRQYLMQVHDYQAMVDPFEGFPSICSREVCHVLMNVHYTYIQRILETKLLKPLWHVLISSHVCIWIMWIVFSSRISTQSWIIFCGKCFEHPSTKLWTFTPIWVSFSGLKFDPPPCGESKVTNWRSYRYRYCFMYYRYVFMFVCIVCIDMYFHQK